MNKQTDKIDTIEKLRIRLEFLTSILPGTIWTEYHWREAMQILQEFDGIVDKEGV